MKHAFAELVAVVTARLAHQPVERRTPVMPDEVLREELPHVLHQPEHRGGDPLGPPLGSVPGGPAPRYGSTP
eukprot:11212415-Alexandrium_andersonii.AAC.1